jgi:hypothetical protein
MPEIVTTVAAAKSMAAAKTAAMSGKTVVAATAKAAMAAETTAMTSTAETTAVTSASAMSPDRHKQWRSAIRYRRRALLNRKPWRRWRASGSRGLATQNSSHPDNGGGSQISKPLHGVSVSLDNANDKHIRSWTLILV